MRQKTPVTTEKLFKQNEYNILVVIIRLNETLQSINLCDGFHFLFIGYSLILKHLLVFRVGTVSLGRFALSFGRE